MCVYLHMGVWVLCWHEWPGLSSQGLYEICLHCIFTGVESSFPRDKHRLTETYALRPLMSTFPWNQDLGFVEVLYEPLLPCSVLASNFFYVLDWTLLTSPEEVIGQCKKLLNTTTPSAIEIEFADEGGISLISLHTDKASGGWWDTSGKAKGYGSWGVVLNDVHFLCVVVGDSTKGVADGAEGVCQS